MPYTAGTLDVLTQAEARTAVGYKGHDTDDVLAMSVAAVSSVLDQRCGPVVQRTVTAEIIETRYRPRIEVGYGPVTSWTSVEEADGAAVRSLSFAGFGETGDVRALPWRTTSAPFSGVLERVDALWWPRVRVTYVAGRYADTASVDPMFKRASILMLKNVWGDMQDGIVQVGEFTMPASRWPSHGWPNAVRDMLRDELLLPGIG